MAGISHFVNPDPGQEGHHDWHWQTENEPETFENWLDITRPSTEQFGLASGNSVGQLADRSGDANFTFGAAAVGVVEGTIATRAFLFGEDVSEATYETLALHWHLDLGLESEFPENELRYIGVRTSGGNFGWIAVMRVANDFGRFVDLRALAWAYQSEPGVPIRAGEIPAVGGVTLFGLLGLTSRRRRSV